MEGLQSPSHIDVEELSKSLSVKLAFLAQSVNEMSSEIDILDSRNSTLQMEINSASKSSSAAHAVTSSGPSTSISSILTILDELADRERRSKNLILYNFSESPNAKSDQSKVKAFFQLFS